MSRVLLFSGFGFFVSLLNPIGVYAQGGGNPFVKLLNQLQALSDQLQNDHQALDTKLNTMDGKLDTADGKLDTIDGKLDALASSWRTRTVQSRKHDRRENL